VVAGTSFRTERDGRDATVIIEGDVDLAEAERLQQLIADLADEGTRTVVVDLQQVGFMGSAGLGALVSGQNRLSEQGAGLRVRSPSPSVRRVLELTALDKVIVLDD